MEVDINFLNKLFIVVWTMNMTYKTKVTTMNQYVGLKVHSAIESGINKNLLFGIRRMMIRYLVTVSVDAHTCYGSMQHTMVSWC